MTLFKVFDVYEQTRDSCFYGKNPIRIPATIAFLTERSSHPRSDVLSSIRLSMFSPLSQAAKEIVLPQVERCQPPSRADPGTAPRDRSGGAWIHVLDGTSAKALRKVGELGRGPTRPSTPRRAPRAGGSARGAAGLGLRSGGCRGAGALRGAPCDQRSSRRDAAGAPGPARRLRDATDTRPSR